ncbi:MAG: beta-lactamase domain protein [Solirubrobacterales bacterium]|jgi:glyoxylase-like metal-dependent hydrolase (beta-lactamase superfamily II)|nr:beta-lactamase domain protein [Solirubrobacterales bacterium]
MGELRRTIVQTMSPAVDVAHIRADNPGPFTLTGTNSYVVGRDGCWVIDPGPALDAHIAALAAEVEARGGAAGILLTHDHGDHADGIPALVRALGGDVPVHAARYPGDVTIGNGDMIGSFAVAATPGHAPDHLAFVIYDTVFSGDAVLGAGSVFVAPDPGALRGYLAGLQLLKALQPRRIWPGHGPVVEDPIARIDAYIAHRLEREHDLLDALAAGGRTIDALLDAAWSDVPDVLRPAAAVTLAAHLDKLEEEGRLPEGVERPQWPPSWYTQS